MTELQLKIEVSTTANRKQREQPIRAKQNATRNHGKQAQVSELQMFWVSMWLVVKLTQVFETKAQAM